MGIELLSVKYVVVLSKVTMCMRNLVMSLYSCLTAS